MSIKVGKTGKLESTGKRLIDTVTLVDEYGDQVMVMAPAYPGDSAVIRVADTHGVTSTGVLLYPEDLRALVKVLKRIVKQGEEVQ